MEYLQNGYTLELCQGAFPLSTDSIALAGFCRLGKASRVLDLGSGCGTLGMLLCARDEGCHVTGLELSSQAHEAALKNARENHLSHRLTSICGDIMSPPEELKTGSFSVCLSNPPYFSQGAPRNAARHQLCCTTEGLFTAAARYLKWGGDFFLVHKPEQLAHLCALGASKGLEAKRLCLLRHTAQSPVNLILMHFRKGAKPGLIWEEQYLHEPDGAPSAYYKTLYHL